MYDAKFWLMLTRLTLLLVFVLIVGVLGAITLSRAQEVPQATISAITNE